MTRDEIFKQCVEKIAKTNCLLLEAATGFGKTSISLRLTNHLLASSKFKDAKQINILILVAKRVHKQTWKDEIEKWGGIHHPTAKTNICMECYESLKNHTKEHWNIVISDETHHIGSEVRLGYLKTMSFEYFIGLSATIPQKLKMLFKYRYHSEVVSCDIIEAIDSDVLPEPTILLFPLQLENTRQSETIEINPKAKGPVYQGEYKDLWKFKKTRAHAILKCTQKQKIIEVDKLIDWYKKKTMSGNTAMKQTWLYFCGKRLEYFADYKLQWVKMILHHLDKERTITFCKTIPQTEELGKNCIHSKNKDAEKVYNDFNEGKIDHITAVNILNENANLVNCKYAIFANLSSSEVVQVQRTGRALRHKKPVIIIPYYKGTREDEIVEKQLEGFKEVRTIHSISEI